MPRVKTSHSHAKTASPGLSSPGIHGRVWIDGPEGTFIGYGRVVLLERIRQYGSITKAAKSMEMAYRRAWDLVDSMNQQAEKPFVEVTTGGVGGGGARVTAEGEKAIAAFWKLDKDFQTFLGKEERKLSVPATKQQPAKKPNKIRR